MDKRRLFDMFLSVGVVMLIMLQPEREGQV